MIDWATVELTQDSAGGAYLIASRAVENSAELRAYLDGEGRQAVKRFNRAFPGGLEAIVEPLSKAARRS